MNQEDLLRELELLPVWQSTRLAPNAPTETTAKPEVVSQVLDVPQQQLRLVLSEDQQWLFLLAPPSVDEAEQLFLNMLKAIGVSIGQDTVITEPIQVAEYKPNVIVVMGEGQAHSLLKEKQPIDTLRGKTHRLAEVPVIVTYSTQYLLENLSDKAKAWEDLCLAKLTIANL